MFITNPISIEQRGGVTEKKQSEAAEGPWGGMYCVINGEFLRQKSHVCRAESQKPQEETALIHLACDQAGIQPAATGSSYRCTQPATQRTHNPAGNPSFAELLEELLHAEPASGPSMSVCLSVRDRISGQLMLCCAFFPSQTTLHFLLSHTVC